MIRVGETICPMCGGVLKYKDRVRRILRGRNGSAKWIWIRRMKCQRCGMVHRELPSFISPYRQYGAAIIEGFATGKLSTEDEAFEDRPSELTVKLWRKTGKQK